MASDAHNNKIGLVPPGVLDEHLIGRTRLHGGLYRVQMPRHIRKCVHQAPPNPPPKLFLHLRVGAGGRIHNILINGAFQRMNQMQPRLKPKGHIPRKQRDLIGLWVRTAGRHKATNAVWVRDGTTAPVRL